MVDGYQFKQVEKRMSSECVFVSEGTGEGDKEQQSAERNLKRNKQQRALSFRVFEVKTEKLNFEGEKGEKKLNMRKMFCI